MYNERLMLAREKRGYTQKELSKIIGLKQQQYARYEKGINIMPITYLNKICVAIDISADYIEGLTNSMKSYKWKHKKTKESKLMLSFVFFSWNT